MMKLGIGALYIRKSRRSSNLGVIVLGSASPPQKCGIGYDVGKIRAGCLVRHANILIVYVNEVLLLLFDPRDVDSGVPHRRHSSEHGDRSCQGGEQASTCTADRTA